MNTRINALQYSDGLLDGLIIFLLPDSVPTSPLAMASFLDIAFLAFIISALSHLCLILLNSAVMRQVRGDHIFQVMHRVWKLGGWKNKLVVASWVVFVLSAIALVISVNFK